MQHQKNIYCVSPVFNDWESFLILAGNIKKLQPAMPDYSFKLIAVNDGSTNDNTTPNYGLPYTQLNLKVNVGHQRAIAVGLQYVYNEVTDADFIVVMDSDGEDIPEHIPALIEKAESTNRAKIIFAQRKKRQESALFKTGYFFYKGIFRFLTGQTISFGNYSVIPKKLLTKVVHQNNIWNHYSGGIIQSRIPFDTLLLDRGKRYSGESKMRFSNLILHGLSSIAVYFDYLSIKVLRYSVGAIAICFLAVLYILYQKIFTDNAIPGWASSLILIISGIMLQLFSVTFIVLLLQLSSRKNISAPDANIYKGFIEDKWEY